MCTTILCFCFLIALKADVGSYNVATIGYKGKTYYLMVFQKGRKLLYDGLCYETYSGEEIDMKADIIKAYSRYDSITIYQNINVIEVNKIEKFDFRYNFPVLSNRVRIAGKELEDINLITVKYSVQNGLTYSPDLASRDIGWIYDYPLEKLFDVSDNELCGMSFYGIKGNLSVIESLRIKVDLIEYFDIDIRRNPDREDFDDLLHRLFDMQIFMIGECSC